MRQVKAIILLFLFVTTFGRCFAEQYGVIGDTDLACCVGHTECCGGEEPTHQEDEKAPDCPVCILIDSSALFSSLSAELPEPVFSLESTFFAIDAWNGGPLILFCDPPDPGGPLLPTPPPPLNVSLSEMVLTAAPVRGPTGV